ncbi:hypothetical protein C7M84_011672 [Penaeus vannamei]|uniref:Uncharacterized protein n=1 Tax=Penaeus vannamei TaxID=6689 RepID=A0A423T0S0_PENVA|nr:hypothetical protein C7M84_011672 [Penaeus vannamei]
MAGSRRYRYISNNCAVVVVRESRWQPYGGWPRCEARSAIERFECGDRVGKRGNQPGRYDEDDGRGTPSPRMTLIESTEGFMSSHWKLRLAYWGVGARVCVGAAPATLDLHAIATPPDFYCPGRHYFADRAFPSPASQLPSALSPGQSSAAPPRRVSGGRASPRPLRRGLLSDAAGPVRSPRRPDAFRFNAPPHDNGLVDSRCRPFPHPTVVSSLSPPSLLSPSAPHATTSLLTPSPLLSPTPSPLLPSVLPLPPLLHLSPFKDYHRLNTLINAPSLPLSLPSFLISPLLFPSCSNLFLFLFLPSSLPSSFFFPPSLSYLLHFLLLSPFLPSFLYFPLFSFLLTLSPSPTSAAALFCPNFPILFPWSSFPSSILEFIAKFCRRRLFSPHPLPPTLPPPSPPTPFPSLAPPPNPFPS